MKKIKLTMDHSMSSYGIPIFVDAKKNPLDYAEGVRRLRRDKQWSVAELAEHCGVSPRTVENWEQGRAVPSKPALLLMQKLLEEGVVKWNPPLK